MEKNSELYDLTQTMQGMIFQVGFSSYTGETTPISPILQLRRGYAESPGWILVQVKEFLPEPLTVEKFRRRAVYSAPKLIQGFLELMASEKWLDRIGDDYYLTEIGNNIIQQRETRVANIVKRFDIVSDDIVRRLENLMRKVVNSSLNANHLLDTWCVTHSRNRAPFDSAESIRKIFQYCSDFNAFRDDAHMAAYTSFGVTGQSWEAFNFVKNDKAKTADGLFGQLAYRGFAKTEWQESLDELHERGWLTRQNDAYHLVTESHKVYDEVELKTDEYFYAPWKALSDNEFHDMCELMQHIVGESGSALSQ